MATDPNLVSLSVADLLKLQNFDGVVVTQRDTTLPDGMTQEMANRAMQMLDEFVRGRRRGVFLLGMELYKLFRQ